MGISCIGVPVTAPGRIGRILVHLSAQLCLLILPPLSGIPLSQRRRLHQRQGHRTLHRAHSPLQHGLSAVNLPAIPLRNGNHPGIHDKQAAYDGRKEAGSEESKPVFLSRIYRGKNYLIESFFSKSKAI